MTTTPDTTTEGPTMTTDTATTAQPPPAPLPMPAGAWRRALLASSLPKHAKVTGAQLSYFADTADDCIVREPSMAVLGNCTELTPRAVLDALTWLARTGWIATVPDPNPQDVDREATVTALCDPTGGAA